MVDHMAEKDSAVDRVDTVQKVMREMSRERARMEYLFLSRGQREYKEHEKITLRGLVEMHEGPHVLCCFFRRQTYA